MHNAVVIKETNKNTPNPNQLTTQNKSEQHLIS